MAKKVRFVYDDKAESRTITATSEASGFPATAAVDLDRSTIWKANAAGTQNLTVDLGSAQTISGLGIANHNVGALTGTQQLRASTDNFAASNDLIKTLVPGASGDYYANFTGVSYRYWRLVTAATGKLWLAVEIVSSDDHRMDTVVKKQIYEAIKVPRLWMMDPRYDNAEVYHSTEYGLMLKGILAGREVLAEPLIPEFQMVITELFVGVFPTS